MKTMVMAMVIEQTTTRASGSRRTVHPHRDPAHPPPRTARRGPLTASLASAQSTSRPWPLSSFGCARPRRPSSGCWPAPSPTHPKASMQRRWGRAAAGRRSASVRDVEPIVLRPATTASMIRDARRGPASPTVGASSAITGSGCARPHPRATRAYRHQQMQQHRRRRSAARTMRPKHRRGPRQLRHRYRRPVWPAPRCRRRCDPDRPYLEPRTSDARHWHRAGCRHRTSCRSHAAPAPRGETGRAGEDRAHCGPRAA